MLTISEMAYLNYLKPSRGGFVNDMHSSRNSETLRSVLF